MAVTFLKQYAVMDDGIDSVHVPEEATHYRFQKGRINFYANAGGDGFHDVPAGSVNAKIKSRRHGDRHTERDIEWS